MRSFGSSKTGVERGTQRPSGKINHLPLGGCGGTLGHYFHIFSFLEPLFCASCVHVDDLGRFFAFGINLDSFFDGFGKISGGIWEVFLVFSNGLGYAKTSSSHKRWIRKNIGKNHGFYYVLSTSHLLRTTRRS